MKNFILSFILPRRMEEHREMNLFIAVLLFLLSMLLCAGIPNKRLEKIIKKNYLSDCCVFPGTYDATFEKPSLPVYSIINGEVDNYQLINDQKVYDIEYKLQDETVVNLKLVYQFDVDDEHGIDKSVFSIDEYLRTNPFNEDHSLKQKDVLAVFTKTGLYYIFNHGYAYGYVNNQEATLEQANYLNVQSWTDSGKWSIYEHDLEVIDGQEVFTEYYYHPKSLEEYEQDPTGKNWTEVRTTDTKIHDFDYKPIKKYNNNLYELFNYGGSSNVGYYSYKTLTTLGEDFMTFDENPLTEISDLLVLDLNSSVRTYNYILSFFYVVVLPIVWVLIVWLVMHKNGELVRFREYYAIASIAFLLPSIVIGIVGYFIPYQSISRFAMILHAGYYFVCVSRINSMGKGKVSSAKEQVIDVNPVETKNYTDIKTKPIEQVNYSGQEEPKKSENRSHISEIE